MGLLIIGGSDIRGKRVLYFDGLIYGGGLYLEFYGKQVNKFILRVADAA